MLGIFILNIASYVYSILYTFKKAETMENTSYRVFQIVTLICWGIYFHEIYKVGYVLNFYSVVATVLSILMLGSFWYLNNFIKNKNFHLIFSNNKPDIFLKMGPYRYVRHPFYSTYIIFYFSVTLYCRTLPSLLCSLSLLLIYLYAADWEERRILNSDYGTEYLKYKRSTGMLFPKFKKYIDIF